MGKLRAAGVSRVVRVRNMEPSRKTRKHHYGMQAMQRERERARERYEQSIRGLGADTPVAGNRKFKAN